MATVHHAIPVGDTRKFIVKNGVVQTGWTVTYFGTTPTYDATEKALYFNTAYAHICPSVDCDIYNKIVYELRSNTDSSSPTMRYYITADGNNISGMYGSQINLNALTGIKYPAISISTTYFLYNVWVD